MSSDHLPLPDAEALCQQLADDVAEMIRTNQLDNPLLIGIRTGGEWIAERINESLCLTDTGAIDISFYRDDFSTRGLHPQVTGSSLPDSIEGRALILVDDVIMSGRTIRAAMNEIFDYGRPASVHLVTLLDVGRRELPIQPDVNGAAISPGDKAIKLTGPAPLTLSLV